jgi:uroporphyrinogen decarboxylase
MAVLREWGIAPTHRAPEPNTWREVLAVIDAGVPVAGQTVGVQEYGKPNVSLTAGLEARGANVRTVKVYGYDFPGGHRPARGQHPQRIAAGELDVVMFTSAHQVINLLRMAERLGPRRRRTREGLDHTIVASIGPTTSESLDDNDVRVDIEPQHGKMGHLVQAAAEHAPQADRAAATPAGSLTRFARAGCAFASAGAIKQTTTMITNVKTQTAEALQAAADKNGAVVRHAVHESLSPRTVRAHAGVAHASGRPLHAGVSRGPRQDDVSRTLQEPGALRRSDGHGGQSARRRRGDHLLRLAPDARADGSRSWNSPKAKGPVIHNPVREARDVERIDELKQPRRSWTSSWKRCDKRGPAMPGQIPVIGFAGAPFTLASYMIEGWRQPELRPHQRRSCIASRRPGTSS